MRRKYGILFILLLVLLAALPCSAFAASKVRLNQSKISVAYGGSYRLKVQGTKKKPKWTTSNKKIATVSSSGVVKGRKVGTAVITARISGKKYKCKVTVKQPVTGIRLSQESLSMIVGGSSALKAVIEPSNASRSVGWSSSNTTAVRVDANGGVYAVGSGSSTITALALDGSKKKAYCKVTVCPQMTISQNTISMTEGDVRTLSVGNTAGSPVLWGSTNNLVVSVSNGRLIAGTAGTAVIMAQKADGSQMVSCSVTVTTQPVYLGPTPAGQKFLNILQKYSNQVRTSKAAGKLWGYSNSSKLNPKTWSAAMQAQNSKGITYNNCALMVRLAMREMGILGESQNFWGIAEGGIHFGGTGVSRTILQHCKIIGCYQTPQELVDQGKLLPGDICTWYANYNHTTVYAGNGLWYDAGRGGDGSFMKKVNVASAYGIDKSNLASDGSDSSSMYIFNSFGPCASMSMDQNIVGQIIRIIK